MCYKKISIITFLFFFIAVQSHAFTFFNKDQREERRKKELESLQSRFQWWPTDSTPTPVKDVEMGGYWWMPTVPGKMRPWGNRGYIYLYKIIYDYKAKDEDETAQTQAGSSQPIIETSAQMTPSSDQSALKPSLLVKKIIKNVKIYFDYNKADLRDDHFSILNNAIKTLGRNPGASFLVTGNCDARGSIEYNNKLGKKRGETVKQFMLEHGIQEDKIIIISRGKLDAVAPISDLMGMQKDRNAQFMIAEVEEIMLPDISQAVATGAHPDEEGKYLIENKENVETSLRVSTREYIVKKDDSLSKIAQQELGGAHRWKYLYELNKDKIKNPNKLKVGQTLIIPVE